MRDFLKAVNITDSTLFVEEPLNYGCITYTDLGTRLPDEPKIILAIIIGSTFMVLVDLLSARITSSMLAIPISVFIGASIAGYIAEKQTWLIGLAVGCLNVTISLTIYFLYADAALLHEGGYSAANVLIMPITTSIICGVLGGIFGRVFKTNIPIFINNIKDV